MHTIHVDNGPLDYDLHNYCFFFLYFIRKKKTSVDPFLSINQSIIFLNLFFVDEW